MAFIVVYTVCISYRTSFWRHSRVLDQIKGSELSRAAFSPQCKLSTHLHALRLGIMLRLSAKQLARGGLAWRRSISGTAALRDEGDSDKGPKAFIEKFKQHVASNVAPPSFPSDFLPKEEEKEEAGVPDKLTLNLYLPHEQRLKDSKVCV